MIDNSLPEPLLVFSVSSNRDKGLAICILSLNMYPLSYSHLLLQRNPKWRWPKCEAGGYQTVVHKQMGDLTVALYTFHNTIFAHLPSNTMIRPKSEFGPVLYGVTKYLINSRHSHQPQLYLQLIKNVSMPTGYTEMVNMVNGIPATHLTSLLPSTSVLLTQGCLPDKAQVMMHCCWLGP